MIIYKQLNLIKNHNVKKTRFLKLFLVITLFASTEFCFAQKFNNHETTIDTSKIQLVNLWKYHSRNPFVSKLPYLGIGYLYNNEVKPITLNAYNLEEDLSSCPTCIELLNLKKYRQESRKSMFLTIGGFTMYAIGAITLVSLVEYNEVREIFSVIGGGSGLCLFFVGSYRLIRKTKLQHQLIKSAVHEFNNSSLTITIPY